MKPLEKYLPLVVFFFVLMLAGFALATVKGEDISIGLRCNCRWSPSGELGVQAPATPDPDPELTCAPAPCWSPL